MDRTDGQRQMDKLKEICCFTCPFSPFAFVHLFCPLPSSIHRPLKEGSESLQNRWLYPGFACSESLYRLLRRSKTIIALACRAGGSNGRGALLFRPAGALISLLHIPTVCASGTARVGYYCFVPPELAAWSHEI